MSSFEPNIWQIIRSSQKDEQYINSLNGDLNRALKQLLGIRSWIRVQDLLTSGNAFLFHFLTTVCGNQTLGEEDCHIVQVTGDRSVPSNGKRLSLALLYSFQHIILNKFIGLVHKLSNRFSNDSVEELRSDVQYILHILQALNLAVFYAKGKYFDLPKRLLSISYLSIYRQESLQDTSKILSYLSLLHVVLSLYSKYNLFRQSSATTTTTTTTDENSVADFGSEADATIPIESNIKCLLCFSKRTNPTLVECGHMFCWNCLTKWLQYKDECPTCRRTVRSNRIVFLHNYS